MAAHVVNLRAPSVCALWILLAFGSLAGAQRFSEPSFRDYPIRNSSPADIEDSLRRFLSDRITSGEVVDVVSDLRTGRLLVRGSDEVQTLASQFIQALDQPAVQPRVAPPASVVRPYPVASLQELGHRHDVIRNQFAQNGVRISPDDRTMQLVIQAPESIHQQIAANWNNPQIFQLPAPANVNRWTQRQAQQAQQVQQGQMVQAQPVVPFVPSNEQLQLENIGWRELLKGLSGVQADPNAVSSPREGTLELQLASESGYATRMQIDQASHVVQISGSADETDEWKRVVKALDSKPAIPGELQITGRLGDAQPRTITRTIALLGGGGTDTASRRLNSNTPQSQLADATAPNAERPPLQLAQAQPQPGNAPAAAQGSGPQRDIARMLTGGDGSGSFLGPVRIEFIEGTDIFIVRGQQRDVDRVMQIIRNIEQLTVDTEPTIEVYQLQHANSEALAALINQLNEEPLAARQGDVSVTPLVKPNALLLIGRDAGVEAVKKIVEKLDVATTGGEQFKVIKLKYLPSVDAERTIFNLYNAVQQQATGTDEVPTLQLRVRVVADFRSNSVAIQGSPRDIAEIEKLLSEIDVERSATVSEVRVFQLKNALAEEVATVLNDTLGTDESTQGQQGFGGGQGQAGTGGSGNANTQPFSSRRALMLVMERLDAEGQRLLDEELLQSGILSNVVVSANERANSVVVVSPEGSMKLIAEIVRQLDELPAQEAEIRVFEIVNGDAATLIDMLDTLFAQDENDDGPLVQSAAGTGESTLVPLRFALDPRTNSIIASGNNADLQVVEAILLKLDSSDVSRRKNTVVELKIQQAQSVANAIAEFVALKRQAIQGIAADTISQYELLDQEVVVVAEPDSNKLIISATEPFFSDIMEVIDELDRRPDMVMVQCLIAEVALGTTEEFGVELGIQDSLLFNRSIIDGDGVAIPGFNFNNQPLGGNVTNPGSARDQLAGQGLSDFGLGRTNGTLGYGGLVLSASSESVSVLIRALQEARRLDVLSRPQVMMLNNTTGEVQVGQQVPYVTGTTNNGFNITNNVEFQQVGLILSVTPRISPDGLVVLDVLAENSQLGSEEDGIPISVTDGVVIRQPSIDTTRARTFVTARDGQTVILGGLITKQRQAFERKVPYLADVPFFGRLFRSDGVAEQRTELLIILTPKIIRDEADVDRVNSEEYARMSWCLGNVIETHGDIGPGTMYEESVIYSGMPSTDGSLDSQVYPNTSGMGVPMDTSNGWQAPTPIPTPAPEAVTPIPSAEQSPSDLAPPSTLPDLPPQARKQSVLLNSPGNASLFPWSGKRLWGRQELGTPSAPAYSVRPASYQGRQSSGKKTAPPKEKQAIYRFDQLPEEN